MIRPITMICWILALGSGLYLYRAKHEVELIDRRIEQIAKDTSDLRVQSRRYLDDWIRLGQPEQLRKYSDQYLGLKTVAPTQFVRLGDLASRLPAPRPDPVDEPMVAVAEPATDAPVSTQAAVEAANGDGSVDEADAETLPIPPIPPAASVLASANPPPQVPLQARPVTARPTPPQTEPESARPRAAADTRPVEEPHATPAKPVAAKPAEPRPIAPNPPIALNPSVASQPRGATPVLTSGQVQAHDLPPLQAQTVAGQTPVSRAPVAPAPAPVGQTLTFRPSDPRGVEPAAAQREVRPSPAAEPRAQPVQMVRQPVQSAPPAAQPYSAPPYGGSVLGMSRTGIPAPMPVNATWSNPR